VTTPANATPVASAVSFTTAEDTALTGTLAGQDADGDALTFSLSTPPPNGSVIIDPGTGHFIYTPNADFSGNDEFSFIVADRRIASAPARVAIQVSAVNDSPVIQLLRAPGAGESGKTVTATLQAMDPETRVASIEVTFADGSTVPGLVMRPDGFEYPLPVTDHPVSFAYRLRVSDTEGNVTQRDFSTTDCPVSASGNLVTLAGSVNAPGVQWVIVGDGYTAGERQTLLQHAIEISELTLSQPPIARHRAGWNVHVLVVPSNESGTDIPSRGFFRDTAFDGQVECGLARLACADFGKVHDKVLPEIAFDELLVLLNSSERAGSGAAEGAVATYAGGNGARVALHELGHTFAGLADEYIDTTIAPGFASVYIEGAYANVTRLSDPARIPWRHWFANPTVFPTQPGEAGIGRFEGSYYHATGYYRPADHSFMRDDDGVLTVVHAEAWVRALYDYVDPTRDSHPAPGVVAMGATPRTFSVPRVFPASVQSLRWYVDGVEDASARDRNEYACCTGLAGKHVLRVDFADITGVIRAPGATEGQASVRWDVDIDPLAPGKAAPPPQKSQPVEQGGVILRMRVDGYGHHVEGATPVAASLVPSVARAVAASSVQWAGPHRRAVSTESFRFDLTDAAGTSLATGLVEDPRVLRGMLGADGQPGHAFERVGVGHYLIRAANVTGLRYLRVTPAGAWPSKAGDPAGQTIDLAPLLGHR
jgi:hypothetical protein